MYIAMLAMKFLRTKIFLFVFVRSLFYHRIPDVAGLHGRMFPRLLGLILKFKLLGGPMARHDDAIITIIT